MRCMHVALCYFIIIWNVVHIQVPCYRLIGRLKNPSQLSLDAHPCILIRRDINSVQPLVIPVGMAVMAIFIAIGFAATYLMIVRQKRREAYEWCTTAPTALPSNRSAGGGFQPPQATHTGSRPATDSSSPYQSHGGYQNPQRSQAAKGNVRTYCMIDGRLINEQ